MFLDLTGTVGSQPALRVTAQEPCDEIPRVFPHLIRELEWIIQDLPVHLGRVLCNSALISHPHIPPE